MNNDEVRFDPMTGEPIQKPTEEPQNYGFDPMTGEPIQKPVEEQTKVETENHGFDPMTGEPLVQIGFDPMTGEPVYGTRGSSVPGPSAARKKSSAWVKVAAGVVGVAAIAAILVSVVKAVIMDESETVALATVNTLCDAKPMILEDLNLKKMYRLIDSKKYTVAFSGEADDVRVEGKYISNSSARQLFGEISAEGERIEGTALLTDSQLKLEIPKLTDDVLVYNYKEEADGYFADLLEDEDISLDDVSEALEKLYEQEAVESKGSGLSKVFTKQMKTWQWEKTDKKEIEVNGKSRKAKGYAVTITEDDAENMLDAIEDYCDEQYKEFMSEYGKDFFDEMNDEIDDFEDVDCKFYVYKNKLASVEIECDDVEMNLYFKGGDFRMQNMEMEIDDGSDSVTIELEGETSGKTETYKLRAERETLFELEYDSLNGEYEVELDPDSGYGVKLKGEVNLNKNEYGFSLKASDGDDSIKGEFSVSGATELKKMSGSEADLFNMSERELRDLFDQDEDDYF